MIQHIHSQSPALPDNVRRPAPAAAPETSAFAALVTAQSHRPAAQERAAAASEPPPQPAAARAEAAAEPPAAASALPPPPAGVPAAYGPAAIEQHMNQWWTGYMQHINANRMAVYNQAVANWKLNAQRHRDLGLPELPPPEPPQLEAVEPKPEGWWFRIHS